MSSSATLELKTSLSIVWAGFLAALCCAPCQADEAARSQLLKGVRTIAKPGVPGPLAVFSKRAFVVALGQLRGDRYAPLIAAGRFGRGRFLAFGHGGYLTLSALRKGDSGRLLENGVRWLCPSRDTVRIALLDAPQVGPYLKSKGLATTTLGRAWRDQLKDFAVLCLTPGNSHSTLR